MRFIISVITRIVRPYSTHATHIHIYIIHIFLFTTLLSKSATNRASSSKS